MSRSLGIVAILIVCVVASSDRGARLREAMRYLERYGYLDSSSETQRRASAEAFDSAIDRFLQPFGLSSTDDRTLHETVDLMRQPRCGMPDLTLSDELRTLWNKTHLRWTVSKVVPSLATDYDQVLEVIDASLSYWSNISHFTFEYVPYNDGVIADIVVSFEENCSSADGPGGVLGHAYYPWAKQRGVVHLDVSETWSLIDVNVSTNLYTTMVHEFGHSLGVPHLLHEESVMFPFYQFLPRSAPPSDIDIRYIRKIYSIPSVTTTTTTTTTEAAPTSVDRERGDDDGATVEFDLTTIFRGELIAFRGSTFTRYSLYRAKQKARTADIRDMFAFPEDVEIVTVSGMYDRFDGKVVVIADDEYYLFDNTSALVPGYPLQLPSLGVSEPIGRVLVTNYDYVYFIGSTTAFRFDEIAETVYGRLRFVSEDELRAEIMGLGPVESVYAFGAADRARSPSLFAATMMILMTMWAITRDQHTETPV